MSQSKSPQHVPRDTKKTGVIQLNLIPSYTNVPSVLSFSILLSTCPISQNPEPL